MTKKHHIKKADISLRERLDIEKGEEIKSVGDFLDKIEKIIEKEEGSSERFFFRGQKVEYWDISSSIFRLGMLKSEHKLLKEPLEKFPNEFKSLKNTFDLMTKCQHYGLCTRLLDLTTNPLVALYFACQSNGKEKYKKDIESEEETSEKYDEREPWGIVYYKKAYPYYSDNENIRIVTELAKYDLEQENTLEEILLKLKENNIISEKEYEEWKKDCTNFIKIIQENYVVQPTNNNIRLTAQSGAFLLPSMFSFDEKQKLITKSQNSLETEFEKDFFYIEGENKEKILKELNICNINESTLFPELEHQLNHIKTINRLNYSPSSNGFTRYERNDNDIKNKTQEIVQQEEINPNFDKDLLLYLQQTIHDETQNKKIYDLIKENDSTIDWYKRENLLSKILLGMNRIIGREKKQKNEEILNFIVDLYRKNQEHK